MEKPTRGSAELIRRNFIFLGIWVLMFAGSVQAATIFMESSIGLSNTFRAKTWTPVSVVIENRGNLIEGVLEVVVRSGNEYKNNIEEASYQKKVELPANSRKKYKFTPYIRSPAHPIKINLHQNGKIIHSESILLQPLVSDKKIALLLGERGNSSFLNEIAEEIHPLFIRPKDLPDIWYGYGGVELVVLQSSILKSLEHKQFQALAQWVENGGFLIINGGVDYSFFTDQAMKSLATIRVIGLERVQQLTALKPFSNETFVSRSPFLVLNARIGGGRTLLREGALPLVTEKSVGAGRVLFLAFDFQSSLFQGWSGNLKFWNWLLRFRPKDNPSLTHLSETQILPSLISSISYQFPGYYFILVFLVFYAVITRIFFNRLQNRFDKQTFNLLLATFFFFSLVSVWVYTQKQSSITKQSQFILLTKHARAGSAFAQQWTAVYSFQPDLLQIENGIEGPPIQLLEAKYVKNIDQERFIQKEGKEKKSIEISTRRWSHQYLASQFSTPFPLTGVFEEEEGDLQLVIENKTSSDIKNGLIYWAQRLIPIGELPSKKRKTIELKKAQIEEFPLLERESLRKISETLEPAYLASHLDRFRKGFIIHLLDAILRNYSLRNDRVLLIGWLQTDWLAKPKALDKEGPDRIALLEWEILSH